MELTRIGVVESVLRDPSDAPRQGDEGAPDAVLVIDAAFTPALDGLAPGDDIIVLSWLDRADRATLRVHPRNDRARPVRGVFSTRSQDRPNPIGLHRCTIIAISLETSVARIHVRPLEAVHGTPVIDIKPVLRDRVDER